MRRIRRIGRLVAFVCALATVAASSAVVWAAPPKVHGDVRQVGDLRVLRVWGSPKEQGFAQGYLLGADGIRLLDSYLKGEKSPDAIKAYEVGSFLMMRNMKISPRYQEEMRGMIEGFRAKLGEGIKVSALNRPLEYRDLVAINCIPETARMGCSSFAVWGSLTADGGTIAGRNLDWFRNPALDDSQVVVLHLESADSKVVSWASLTWPGFIGCLTGMNAEGVTISVHDAPADLATDGANLTPRGLALREALESAHSASASSDVLHILQQRTCMVGNNIPVAMPFLGKGAGSVVFEYDGMLDHEQGVTVRSPEGSSQSVMQICTNHYRKRAGAISCDRYERLEAAIAEMKQLHRTVDVDVALELLKSVAMSGRVLTYQSVVFEPNRHRMHICVSEKGKPAGKTSRVTLELDDLLKPGH